MRLSAWRSETLALTPPVDDGFLVFLISTTNEMEPRRSIVPSQLSDSLAESSEQAIGKCIPRQLDPCLLQFADIRADRNLAPASELERQHRCLLACCRAITC